MGEGGPFTSDRHVFFVGEHFQQIETPRTEFGDAEQELEGD